MRVLRIILGAGDDRYLDAVSARVTVGNLSPATRDNYAADPADFTRIIGADMIVDDITGQDVDAAIARFGSLPDRRFVDPTRKRAPGIAAATQKRFRQSVSKFCSHAAQNGWVQLSPMQWPVLNPTVGRLGGEGGRPDARPLLHRHHRPVPGRTPGRTGGRRRRTPAGGPVGARIPTSAGTASIAAAGPGRDD